MGLKVTLTTDEAYDLVVNLAESINRLLMLADSEIDEEDKAMLIDNARRLNKDREMIFRKIGK